MVERGGGDGRSQKLGGGLFVFAVPKMLSCAEWRARAYALCKTGFYCPFIVFFFNVSCGWIEGTDCTCSCFFFFFLLLFARPGRSLESHYACGIICEVTNKRFFVLSVSGKQSQVEDSAVYRRCSQSFVGCIASVSFDNVIDHYSSITVLYAKGKVEVSNCIVLFITQQLCVCGSINLYINSNYFL